MNERQNVTAALKLTTHALQHTTARKTNGLLRNEYTSWQQDNIQVSYSTTASDQTEHQQLQQPDHLGYDDLVLDPRSATVDRPVACMLHVITPINSPQLLIVTWYSPCTFIVLVKWVAPHNYESISTNNQVTLGICIQRINAVAQNNNSGRIILYNQLNLLSLTMFALYSYAAPVNIRPTSRMTSPSRREWRNAQPCIVGIFSQSPRP